MVPDRQTILRQAAKAAFDQPRINNVFRSVVVEAIVDAALGDGWRWCSGDWAAFDFQHRDRTRLEVKQSAARQSWARPGDKPSSCSFDIASRKGYWEEGVRWVPFIGRNADIYVLAHHPVSDETADHRDPAQWLFYVVLASTLPDQRRISLSGVRGLTDPVSFPKLADEVDRFRMAISNPAHG